MWFTISLSIFMVCGIGILAIVLEYMKKMETIKMGIRQEGSKEVMTAIESLRQEVAELRDTTTRYDLSFDTALQRMESRIGHLETQQRNQQATAQDNQASLRQ
jgi:hypothetical protein